MTCECLHLKPLGWGGVLRKLHNEGLRYDATLERNADPTSYIQKYKPEIVEEADILRTIEDMRKAAREQQINYDEYFLFGFDRKGADERREFISDIRHFDYVRRLNKPWNAILFHDKWKTYLKFREYYKRDAIYIKDSFRKSKDKIAEFVEKHSRYIVKPLNTGFGIGVKIVNSNGMNTDQLVEHLETLYSDYRMGRYKREFIIEELVLQDGSIHDLHPESVNSMRIPTVRTGRKVNILYPVLRVGTGLNCVDNGGANGIIMGVDDNGVVNSAYDESGNQYTCHPDTGKVLIGYQIPEYERAIEMAKELAMVVPSNRYTGWDLAYSTKGWVMIEGNYDGQFILGQLAYQKGFKTELETMM